MIVLILPLVACVRFAGPDIVPSEQCEPAVGATSLAGTEWVLVSLRECGLPDEARITLHTEDDSPYTKFVGDAICNSYGARNVATEKEKVEINAVESSTVGCGENGNRLVRDYYDALREATNYRIQDSRSEIRGSGDETMLAYERERSLPDSGGAPVG